MKSDEEFPDVEPVRKAAPVRNIVYDPAYVDLVRAMSAVGATDFEIAAEFGVHYTTLYRWKALHPEFAKAWRVGQEAAEDRVEASLYRRAIGYEVPTEKIFYNKDTSEVVRVDTSEHIAPSETAIAFYLKNRRPDRWNDKVMIDAKLSLEELVMASVKQHDEKKVIDVTPTKTDSDDSEG